MSDLRIVLGDDLNFSSELTSPIWLEIDGCAFPGEDWDDFSYTLLGWWSDALLSCTKLLRKKKTLLGWKSSSACALRGCGN